MNTARRPRSCQHCRFATLAPHAPSGLPPPWPDPTWLWVSGCRFSSYPMSHK